MAAGGGRGSGGCGSKCALDEDVLLAPVSETAAAREGGGRGDRGGARDFGENRPDQIVPEVRRVNSGRPAGHAPHRQHPVAPHFEIVASASFLSTPAPAAPCRENRSCSRRAFRAGRSSR
ncbi:MAG: hypothetical protein ACLTDR_08480 [Adlercreutzia equolifaciens]